MDVPSSPNTGGRLVRHPDLWFSDGSVVLQAETTLFRVHKSQLSRRSEFFRDLFSLPQSQEIVTSPSVKSERTMEGCPVLVLDDLADDVANLLAVLYDGTSFGDNGPDDFHVVSGVLRLSTKYIVDSLRAKAIAHLSIAWPTSLRDWDSREEEARAYETGSSREESSHRPRYPSPIDVINLARTVEAPSLLPSAFYDLSRYSFAQILEPTDEAEALALFSRSFISPTDFQKLSLGKESAQQAVITLIQALGQSPLFISQSHRDAYSSSALTSHNNHLRRTSGVVGAPGRTCTTQGACRKEFAELVELATEHYVFDREHGCLDPLYVAEELGQLMSSELSECKACAQSLELWSARERERMWKLIPTWFRLEGVVTTNSHLGARAISQGGGKKPQKRLGVQ